MYGFVALETVLVQFEQALAAARRYDSLRYPTPGRDRCARSDIPQRIFEEFYAGKGKAGHVSRTRNERSRMIPSLGLRALRVCGAECHEWSVIAVGDLRCQ
jgi:hypothetical protein